MATTIPISQGLNFGFQAADFIRLVLLLANAGQLLTQLLQPLVEDIHLFLGLGVHARRGLRQSEPGLIGNAPWA